VGIGFAVPINTVRELLTELRGGKVTRGRIGVQIMNVARESFEDLGLSERMGAIVSSVQADGPAAAANMQPGDVILRYNGNRVENTENLQNQVSATRPGTTVPIIVLRAGTELTLNVTIEELDLETEAEPTLTVQDNLSEGFGMTLQDLTPLVAGRLGVPDDTEGAVIVDLETGGAAGNGGARPGDVVLSVNRAEVTTAIDAVRELNLIESGRTAFLLVQRGPNRVFLQVLKE
jgi:serine protease Do